MLAIKIADIYQNDLRKKLTSPKKFKSVFPSTEFIYERDIVIENEPENFQYKKYVTNLNESRANQNFDKKFKKNYEYDDYDGYYKGYKDADTTEIELVESNQDGEEELEYVLVRDRGDRYGRKNKFKKTLYDHHNSGRKNTENFKINKFLEAKNIVQENDSFYAGRKTNHTSDNNQYNSNSGGERIEIENIIVSEPSDENEADKKIDNLNITNSEKLLENNIENLDRNIYRKRDKSRFEFVNDLTGKNIIECHVADLCPNFVPEFVSQMLYKKISSINFFKKFTCVEDKQNDKLYFDEELKNNNNSWATFIRSDLE